MATAERPLTLEQFLELPEEEPALEFEDGRTRQKVSPKFQHGRLQSKFAELVNQFAEPKKLALASTETRVTFGGYSRVPDVIVFSWDRIPLTAEGELVNDILVAPDIAVEIVSPEQSANYLVRRCLWYVANGVRIALLFDPRDRSVILFRPGAPLQPLEGDDQIDLSEMLPGFQLTVKELFDSLKLV
jgi:Uma2 family endonuclease